MVIAEGGNRKRAPIVLRMRAVKPRASPIASILHSNQSTRSPPTANALPNIGSLMVVACRNSYPCIATPTGGVTFLEAAPACMTFLVSVVIVIGLHIEKMDRTWIVLSSCKSSLQDVHS